MASPMFPYSDVCCCAEFLWCRFASGFSSNRLRTARPQGLKSALREIDLNPNTAK